MRRFGVERLANGLSGKYFKISGSDDLGELTFSGKPLRNSVRISDINRRYAPWKWFVDLVEKA